jgi:phosphatidylglycerol:prolipoprotein diacylglycerol transferase
VRRRGDADGRDSRLDRRRELARGSLDRRKRLGYGGRRVFPVLFQIGPFTVYSFGVLMALGFYVGATVSAREYERRGGDSERMWNFLVWVFIAGLAGSKLLSLANDPAAFFRDPIEQTLSGSGFVWYGGLIGGFVAAWFLSRSYQMRFSLILECTALGLAIGQAIGRIGCHVAGDGDWGTESTLPWAVAYENAIVGWDYPPGVRVHPTPIYEAIAYTVLFLAMLAIRKRGYREGTVFCVYLLGSSLVRFLVEFIRINPVLAMGLTQAQWIAIVLALGGAGWLLLHRPVPARVRERTA